MEIILGRDEVTHKLKVIVDGKQPKLLGAEGSVNDYVSRKHISLTAIEGTNQFVLKNLSAGNTTLVNGHPIVQKVVSREDRVELGAQKYMLDWKLLQEVMPRISDVRPLRAVWAWYEDEMLKEKISERRFNALRGGIGILSTAAIALSFVPGFENVRMLLYGAFLVGMVAFTIISMKNSSKAPLRQQRRQKEFQRRYVCPCCGHFFGTMDYDVLFRPKENCPNCKAKLVK